MVILFCTVLQHANWKPVNLIVWLPLSDAHLKLEENKKLFSWVIHSHGKLRALQAGYDHPSYHFRQKGKGTNFPHFSNNFGYYVIIFCVPK